MTTPANPDDLIARLHAQLDDDERWALAASRDGDRHTPTGEHWRWECEASDTPATVDPMLSEYVEGVDGAPVGLRSIEGYPSTWGATLYHLVIRGQDELPAAVAGHIARHDPARVLAEVDAKRRIMAIHSRRADVFPDDAGGTFDNCCHGCGYEGICDDPVTENINDCPVLRALALPHADRPGYREERQP